MAREEKLTRLKDLPFEERPRERLLLKGSSSLSAIELMALILGRGVPGESVINLSERILAKFGDLHNLGKISAQEFLSIDGIGVAKACQIVAAFEIARRISGGNLALKSREYQKTEDIYKLVKPYLMSRQKEHFIIICLDSRKRLIGIDNISIGTINQSLVHPREVFKAAVNRSASYIILAHNHPTGDVSPSLDDITTTQRLVDASYMMGIPIVDHIIVSDQGYLSLRDEEYISYLSL